MSQNNPNNTDAILGGQNPPPIDAVVLGGEIGRKQRLQHEKAIARQNKFWQNFEYLDSLPDRYAATFANRQVVNFEPEMEIVNPQETAYALREGGRCWDITNSSDISMKDKWDALLENPRVSEVEALVFGNGILSFDYVRQIVDNYHLMYQLKGIFFGDIEDRERMISDLSFGDDISPVLSICPDLEILQIRCGGYSNNLYFSEWRHEKLKALRIESSGLNRSAITSLCQLELPALEYLELWTGSQEYGSDSSIEDVIPIICGERFPKLKYLGIKNCEYTNDVVVELVKSPLMQSLIELDLSMGNLNMEGFSKLIEFSGIDELDKINVSRNSLNIRYQISDPFTAFSETYPSILNLKCELIVNNQRGYFADGSNRYCSIRE